MTKRKNNAQKPAASQPEAIGDNQPAAGLEPQAAALVEGDGGVAAGGAEHAGQPAPADGGADAARLVDADVPYAGGDDTTLVSPAEPDGATEDGGALAGWPDFIRDDIKFVTALPEEGVAGDQVMTYDAGVYTAFEWIGEPPHWERLAELGTRQEPEPVDLRAGNVDAAIAAASLTYDQALRILGMGDYAAWQIREQHPELLALTRADYAEAARLLREIGHARATTPVVATQLKLAGLRTEPLDVPETIALEAFLFTLVGLDGMADGLARAIAKELEDRLREPPPPVPIEDTTLETVDGPLDTWRS